MLIDTKKYVKLEGRYGERLLLEQLSKPGGGERLTHTRWSGERGYLRRGKWIGVGVMVCC